MKDKPPVVEASELLFRERELGVPPIEPRQHDVRWVWWAVIGGSIVFWAVVFWAVVFWAVV